MEKMITISLSKYEGLKKLVEQLHEELSLLKQSRDSSTSSTSPFQDLNRSNRNSLRQSSGKKSGGQSGHAGRHLSMSATPDTIIDHIPETCAKCGKSLETVEVIDNTHRQVVDIPKPLPVYTEDRSHRKICSCCGNENKGIYPDEVKAFQWL
jgi:transposase